MTIQAHIFAPIIHSKIFSGRRKGRDLDQFFMCTESIHKAKDKS